MTWNTTPRLTITTAEPDANATDGVARVTTFDQYRRIVAPGKTIEMGEHRYAAGDAIMLTAAECDELERDGGIEPLNRKGPVDLRRVRQQEIQIGRITELEG